MNAIEIKDLKKVYDGFTLGGLDLNLPSGYIMGLIGENGAGKSTLIKLVLGMLHADGGSVKILGADNDRDIAKVREEVGVVLDDVGFPECMNIHKINRIMRAVYKNWDEEKFFCYVDRFSIPKEKEYKEYSRGMRMKTGLAVALSHNPRVLILDEATNGLDPAARDDVNNILNEFTRDERNSVFISSHIVSDLERICDYIVFIHKGKLMVCEEKDRLRDEYAIVHCSEKDLEKIPSDMVYGAKINEYGAEAAVKKSAVPSGLRTVPISIEELFVHMIKEADRK